MNDFHFLRPQAFFLILPFVVFLILFLRNTRQTKIWEKICSPDLLPYILKGKTKRSSFPSFILFSTICLLLFASAGPSWQMISQPVVKSSTGLVIALDLSSTMNAQDIKPSRAQRAIYKINDILTLRKDGQTALIVFSDEAFVVTPLTDDIATIKSMLNVLSTNIMPSTGHQVSQAVSKGIDLLKQAKISDGTVLLVTAELTSEDLIATVGMAKENNLQISVLGIGTEENTPIPQSSGGFKTDNKGGIVITKLAKANLNQLATSTAGYYTTITSDDTDVNYLMTHLPTVISSNNNEKTEVNETKWHDQGYLFVLLALPLTAFLFRKGILFALLFMLPFPMDALTWKSLWETDDQQAQQFFDKGEYQEAKQQFKDPAWQAATDYKLGDYASASEFYQHETTADGLFNYGTSKAKEGDFKAAIAAYKKVLKIDPHHEDTLHNKQVIEDFLKNQPPSDKDKNSDNKEDQSKSDQNNEQEKSDQSNPNKEGSNDQESNKPREKEENDPSSKPNDKSSDGVEEKKNEKELTDKEMEDLANQYKDKLKDEEKEKTSETPEEIPTPIPLQENEQQRIDDDRLLQRVVDDPGALLKRKFLQQYKQRKS